MVGEPRVDQLPADTVVVYGQPRQEEGADVVARHRPARGVTVVHVSPGRGMSRPESRRAAAVAAHVARRISSFLGFGR